MPRNTPRTVCLAILIVSACSLLPGRVEARPAEDPIAPPASAPRVPSLAGAIFDNSSRMDVNTLDMAVTNHGAIAYDLLTGNAGLVYPKGSGLTVLFAAGLWVGARVNGGTRVAVAEYGQEYTPGPMMGGTFLPDAPEFRNYRIESGGAGYGDYLAYAVPQGAPLDAQGNPLLLGDVTIWSVFNDADPALHSALSGRTAPLGIEVQQTVFAFNRAGPLGKAIFVKWKLTNKGANTLDDAYISLWCDPDLGAAADDLVGCDTTLSLGYCYNATNADAFYGSKPPAVGFRLLRGPVVQVSPGVYDTLGLTSFNKYVNGTDPAEPFETYNYMLGLHADGSPVYVNDDPSQPITTFQVSGLDPGQPNSNTNWLDSNPGDRRMMLSSGPVHMAPGDVQEVLYVVVVGQGTDRLSSITDLRVNALAAGMVVPPVPGLLSVDLDLEPDAISLLSHNAWVTAYIEPLEFDPASIVPSSVRLAGSVPAESKFAVVGDHDGDGAPDLMLKFARESLDPLLTPGTNLLAVTGSLLTGEAFEGFGTIRVLDHPAGTLAAAVSPNPLNPAGILRFATSRPGPARVTLYDVHGRRVRILMDTPGLPAGAHEVPIEMLGERGAPLGSGVYFFRVEAQDGSAAGRVAVLK